MACHEPRNSKVAELRSCNRGFHNVGFDFSMSTFPVTLRFFFLPQHVTLCPPFYKIFSLLHRESEHASKRVRSHDVSLLSLIFLSYKAGLNRKSC